MKTKSEIKKLGGDGILTEEDLVSFSEAETNIIYLMRSGGWFSATSIIKASNQREGLRRLRNLRSKGYEVERKRFSEFREFFYRLIPEEIKNTPEKQLKLEI